MCLCALVVVDCRGELVRECRTLVANQIVSRAYTRCSWLLAWAPDDSHLVSCSLDSDGHIIVWKLTDIGSQERRTQATVLCNPYKILGKGIHTSTVKGVTFDPAGSYIASSGDDPAVCIWRAHDDWGLEKRIGADDGIFRKWKDVQELTGQTLFRRLSWSTDGSYICSSNSSVKKQACCFHDQSRWLESQRSQNRRVWSCQSCRTQTTCGRQSALPVPVECSEGRR